MQGGQCYFMIMLSLCTPTNERSEGLRERKRETRSKGEEREQTQPPLHPRGGVFFFSVFSVTWSFCFSQLALHAERMVIFIVIIALNLRVHL